MKRLFCCLAASVAIALSGCDTITHVMTFESPINYSQEKTSGIFNNLEVANSVYDDAVIVRGGVVDDVYFDEKSKVYNFDTGRSPFKTYNLPLNATSIRVEVISKIGQSVFAPCIALLTKDHRLIKKFESNSFEYRPLADIASDNLRFRFNLNNFSAGEHAVAYMVIYTDNNALKGSTRIVHPAKIYAKAHHNDVPNLEDPLIPHSPLGELTVTISLNSEDNGSMSDLWDSLKGPIWGGENHSYISDDDEGAVNSTKSKVNNEPGISVRDDGAVVVNPRHENDVQVKAQQKAAANADPQPKTVVAKPAGSMLKETEDMYNNMITSAVKSGDIAKAMKLAQEAENAGSPSAASTLNNAVKNYHK